MSVNPVMELEDVSASEIYGSSQTPSRHSYAAAVRHNNPNHNSLARPDSTANLVAPKKKQRNSPIQSSNYCGLCLYNIPEGTLMFLLPGLALLILGAVLCGVWGVRLDGAGFICIILGALFTCCGSVYWFIAWRKHPPSLRKKAKDGTPVKLNGAFTISDVDGNHGVSTQAHHNRAFEAH
jgi:hypothetical protein